MRIALTVAPGDQLRRRRALVQVLYRTFLTRAQIIPSGQAADVEVAWGYPPRDPAAPCLSMPIDPALLAEPREWRVGAARLLGRLRGLRDAEAARRVLFRHEGRFAVADADLPSLLLGFLDQLDDRASEAEDEHGRFAAVESLLFREESLGRPIVDLVAWALGLELSRLSGHRDVPAPESVLGGASWTLVPSMDIDSDGMFRGTNAWRAVRDAALMGPATLARASGRALGAWTRMTRDPHLCVAEIGTQLEAIGVQTTFFCQTHRFHRLDNYSLNASRALLRDVRAALEAGHEVGLHFSYATRSRPALLDTQWARLNAAFPEAVAAMRAHYLRVGTDDPWRARDVVDSSIGFAGASGFRLGTAIPFGLDAGGGDGAFEVPPCAMDVTLRHREGHQPERATEVVLAMARQAAQYGGCVALVWHPNNMEGLLWPRWREALYDIILEARRAGAFVGPISEVARLYRAHYKHVREAVDRALTT